MMFFRSSLHEEPPSQRLDVGEMGDRKAEEDKYSSSPQRSTGTQSILWMILREVMACFGRASVLRLARHLPWPRPLNPNLCVNLAARDSV